MKEEKANFFKTFMRKNKKTLMLICSMIMLHNSIEQLLLGCNQEGHYFQTPMEVVNTYDCKPKRKIPFKRFLLNKIYFCNYSYLQ